MLDRAGFRAMAEDEIKGSVEVIEGSLAGPKGTVLDGQIDSLRVIRAESKYLSFPRQGQPDVLWLGTVSLQRCEEAGTQPAAAPDASRR